MDNIIISMCLGTLFLALDIVLHRYVFPKYDKKRSKHQIIPKEGDLIFFTIAHIKYYGCVYNTHYRLSTEGTLVISCFSVDGYSTRFDLMDLISKGFKFYELKN